MPPIAASDGRRAVRLRMTLRVVSARSSGVDSPVDGAVRRLAHAVARPRRGRITCTDSGE
jgi:hypothetical protein